MKGFGVHTSMWTMSWDAEGAARAIAAATESGMDFISQMHKSTLQALHDVHHSIEHFLNEITMFIFL